MAGASEEFILEIQSTEDITSADYLKAVVEKCLQSLNDGEAPTDASEPVVEIIEGPEESPRPDRYIDFDEYMVNEVVICDSDDEVEKEPRAAQRVVVDLAKENEVIDSIRNDHMYHEFYRARRRDDLTDDDPQTYITIIEEADGNIEIVKTEGQIKRGRKKGIKKESEPKRPKKEKVLKEKKVRVPKPPKAPRAVRQPRVVKERVKKERQYNVSTGEKSLTEVVIRKPDVELTVANSVQEDITHPSVQQAIKALKEDRQSDSSNVKGNFSIYDQEGKVIMPFAVKRYSDDLPFWCDECEFKTNTRQRLKLHRLRRHGGVKQFQCCECSYSAHDAYSVRVHYGNMHCDTKKYKCDQCTFACNYQAGLRKHKNKSHGNKKPYVCSKCGYEQYNITILKQHIQSVHMGIMPFSCNYCNKRFIDERRMHLHVQRMHYRLKRFRCAKCSFSAFNKCEVKKHLFSHHIRVARLECSECDYKCKSKHELVQHIKKCHRSNSEVSVPVSKKQVCQFCDFQSSQYRDLATHMRDDHGINKNVRCDACEFVTFDLTLLKKHIKEKHNPDLLRCKNCNFSTMNWVTLKEHRKSHANKVSFPCKLCNAVFRYKMCLTKHEVIKHGRDLKDEPEDDKDTMYEKRWISYDKGRELGGGEGKAAGKSSYVGVNPVTNLELERLIADTVAGEDPDDPTDSDYQDLPTYLCTTCNIVFRDKMVLDWHVNKHDLDETLHMLLSSKDKLAGEEGKEELLSTLTRKYHTCGMCGYASDDTLPLVLHMVLDHHDSGMDHVEGDVIFTSIKVEQPDPDMPQQHKSSRRLSLPMLKCSGCGFTTVSRSLFLEHGGCCAGDNQYLVPCEIVISDVTGESAASGEEVYPVQLIGSDYQQGNWSTVLTRRRSHHRNIPPTLSASHQPEDAKTRPRKLYRKKKTKFVSDDEAEEKREEEVFNCTECSFVCHRKRTLARHFINLHINQPAKDIKFNKLKETLLEKMGLKEPPDDLDTSYENDRDPDDPVAEPQQGLVDLVGDPFEELNPDDGSADKDDEEIHSIDIIPCQQVGGDKVRRKNKPVKRNQPRVKPKPKPKKPPAEKKSASKDKIELLSRLALKRTGSEKVAKTKESEEVKESTTPVRKSSRRNAGQNPKGLLSVKDIRLLMYGRGKSPELDDSPPPSVKSKVTKEKSKQTPLKSSEPDDGTPPTAESKVTQDKSKQTPVKRSKTSDDKIVKNKMFKQDVLKKLTKDINRGNKSDSKSEEIFKEADKITKAFKNLIANKTPVPTDKSKESVMEESSEKEAEEDGSGVEENKRSVVFEEPICQRCEVKMCSWEALNMHTILAHGYSILLTCSYCCYTTSDKSQLREHINRCFLLNS